VLHQLQINGSAIFAVVLCNCFSCYPYLLIYKNVIIEYGKYTKNEKLFGKNIKDHEQACSCSRNQYQKQKEAIYFKKKKKKKKKKMSIGSKIL